MLMICSVVLSLLSAFERLSSTQTSSHPLPPTPFFALLWIPLSTVFSIFRIGSSRGPARGASLAFNRDSKRSASSWCYCCCRGHRSVWVWVAYFTPLLLTIVRSAGVVFSQAEVGCRPRVAASLSHRQPKPASSIPQQGMMNESVT